MSSWNRRAILWGSAGLAVVGCMPKTAPITAASPTPIALAGVLAGKRATVRALPEGVQRRIERLLEARKLIPTPLSVDTLKEPLSLKRSTSQRLDWLSEQAERTDTMMLIELEAFYDTQIQGRLRWTVRGTLSIASASAPDRGVQRTVDTAVFLQFLHQAEAEAVLEAATTIERTADRLLDDWLRARA